jgi:acetylornithine deacetylase/succinyl-diaminopimelate desuccinylase-like protein
MVPPLNLDQGCVDSTGERRARIDGQTGAQFDTLPPAMRLGSALVLALLLSAWPMGAPAQLPPPGPPTPDQTLLREIYKELVEINTTDSVGGTTAAARAMAARLKAGGFTDADMQIIVPPGAPKKGNLVARLKGTGARKPLLLLAHLDVVEAKREDWERDPFKLVEEGGYFYARGSVDDKAMAAIFVANLIRYKQEGYLPERDLILALTADEELGSSSPWNGVGWLLKHQRALIEAELALNEGGGAEMTREGRPVLLRVQAAEKVSVSFRLRARTRAATARCRARTTRSTSSRKGSRASHATSSPPS